MSMRAAVATLRPAAADECAALSELCLRSKGHWGYDADFLEACREELTIRPDDIGDLLRVAVLEGEIAGVVQLAHSGSECCVEKLFIDPRFIGKGVGSMLMRWAAETAHDQGAARLLIEADPNAASFYRRFGARDAGEVASGSIPGRVIPLLALDLG